MRAFTELMDPRGLLDFDDLVVSAVAALEAEPPLRVRWQERFSHLWVDEFQDVDSAQLRLVQLLASPEDNLFVVGDDDQPYFGIRSYRPAVPLDHARRVIYGRTASRPTAEP